MNYETILITWNTIVQNDNDSYVCCLLFQVKYSTSSYYCMGVFVTKNGFWLVRRMFCSINAIQNALFVLVLTYNRISYLVNTYVVWNPRVNFNNNKIMKNNINWFKQWEWSAACYCTLCIFGGRMYSRISLVYSFSHVCHKYCTIIC
jgi:hypothetical protein